MTPLKRITINYVKDNPAVSDTIEATVELTCNDIRSPAKIGIDPDEEPHPTPRITTCKDVFEKGPLQVVDLLTVMMTLVLTLLEEIVTYKSVKVQFLGATKLLAVSLERKPPKVRYKGEAIETVEASPLAYGTMNDDIPVGPWEPVAPVGPWTPCAPIIP